MATWIPITIVNLVSNRSEVWLRGLCRRGQIPCRKEPIKLGTFQYYVMVEDVAEFPGVVIHWDEVDRLAQRTSISASDENARLKIELAQKDRRIAELEGMIINGDTPLLPSGKQHQPIPLKGYAKLPDDGSMTKHIDYTEGAYLSKRAYATLAAWHGGKLSTVKSWKDVPDSARADVRTFLIYFRMRLYQTGKIKNWHHCENAACPCPDLPPIDISEL